MNNPSSKTPIATANFVVNYPDDHIEVVDVKGVKTALFRLKAKLMKAVHGIEIKIV